MIDLDSYFLYELISPFCSALAETSILGKKSLPNQPEIEILQRIPFLNCILYFPPKEKTTMSQNCDFIKYHIHKIT